MTNKAGMTRSEIEWRIVQYQLSNNRAGFIKRLESMLERDGDCRLWKGRLKADGYGQMNFRIPGVPRERNHFSFTVHRLFLILKIGAPIPDDKEAGHYHCHNRRCVAHVQLETRQENLAARDQRYRQRKAEGNPIFNRFPI